MLSVPRSVGDSKMVVDDGGVGREEGLEKMAKGKRLKMQVQRKRKEKKEMQNVIKNGVKRLITPLFGS